MTKMKHIHDKFEKHVFDEIIKAGEQELRRCGCGCLMIPTGYVDSRNMKEQKLVRLPLSGTTYIVKHLKKQERPEIAVDLLAQQLETFNTLVAPALSNKTASKTIRVKPCNHDDIQPVSASHCVLCQTCGMTVFRHDVNPFAIATAFGVESGLGQDMREAWKHACTLADEQTLVNYYYSKYLEDK